LGKHIKKGIISSLSPVLILKMVFNPQLPMIDVKKAPKKYQRSHEDTRNSVYNKLD